jgi:hypothetical protein
MGQGSGLLALSLFAAVAASCAAIAGRSEGAGQGGSQGDAQGGLTTSPCSGLQCQGRLDDCAAQGKPPTTISGYVYDPAGKLPLYNVYVYIPNEKLDPIVPGHPVCTQCEAPASGSPVVGSPTDATGRFFLHQKPNAPWGVPSGDDIPLVLQVGKWRRQVVVPHIEACSDNWLPDPAAPADKLRLPAKSSEGDMPLIAFTSGCDPAECFLRRIGIDDTEFVPPGSPAGHVHFYTGRDFSSTGPTGNASYVEGGNGWSDTFGWWNKTENLQKYDIVFNACDCANAYRGLDAYQAIHNYLDTGGRVFATHYFYGWFAPPYGPAAYQSVADWALPEENMLTKLDAFVDTAFPKGQAFADWLMALDTTKDYGQPTISDTRWNMNAVTSAATRWIYNGTAANDPAYATMYMSFNTPVGQPANLQCGRAVLSDVHLSGVSDDSQFPNECVSADPGGEHAVNEIALEFLFFDLSSCVQDDSKPPPPPPEK